MFHEITVGFSVDNNSKNLGAHNSTLRYWLEIRCYFVGCPCHITCNTANKGAIVFTPMTGFDVEEFCIDSFHFDRVRAPKGKVLYRNIMNSVISKTESF